MSHSLGVDLLKCSFLTQDIAEFAYSLSCIYCVAYAMLQCVVTTNEYAQNIILCPELGQLQAKYSFINENTLVKLGLGLILANLSKMTFAYVLSMTDMSLN